MCMGTGAAKAGVTRRSIKQGMAVKIAKRLQKNFRPSATAKASRRSTRTGGAGVNASNMQ